MRLPEVSKTVQVPDNVTLSIVGKKINVKGAKGTLTRDFSFAPISIEGEGKNVRVWAKWPRKKEAALVGTVRSHIQNMIKGVTTGFTFKLKIVFSHFPITAKVAGNHLSITNFTGERSPRKAKIMGTTKVMVKGEDIIVQGISLEDVSQTAANIQNSTKIRRKDPRVFLDGIYVYEKHEGFQE